MNEYKDAFTSFIITICDVLFKPTRKYFGQILFGALMRTGTISTWLRGLTEGTAKRIYEQLTRIGLRDEYLQRAYSKWLIESLVLNELTNLELIIDDSPIKRYGKHVQGAGLHHNPTDKSNVSPVCYGFSLVMLAVRFSHPRWGTIALPLRWRLYVCEKDLKTISERVRPAFKTKLEIAAELLFDVKALLDKAGIQSKITVLFDRGYVSSDLFAKVCQMNFRVVTRFKKNAIFFELPNLDVESKRRGRPRLYGSKRRINDIVSDPSIPLFRRTVSLYGRRTPIEYKSIVLTSSITKGVPILVVASRLIDKKGDAKEWGIFVSSDLTLDPSEVVRLYSLRFSIEELFKDLKQDCGLGLQQTRRFERSAACVSIVIVGYSLVEVWALDRDEKELKIFRNAWDDPERRPSHQNKLCAMRKNMLWSLYFEQYTDRVNPDLLNKIYEDLIFYASAI